MPRSTIPTYLFLSPVWRSLLLIALITIQIDCASNSEGDSDTSAINVRSYEDMKVIPEIENNCDLRVMRAYSVYGDAKSLSTPNELFPAIKQNCCGPNDQQNIKALWRKTANIITKNQKYFLYLAKGILSQSQDYMRMAAHAYTIYDRVIKKGISIQMVKKDYPGIEFYQGDVLWHNKNYKLLINADFIKFAEKIKSGMDTQKLKIMYHNFNQAMEFVMNIRRTFYGMICSVEGQKASTRRGFLSRVFMPNDIFYGTPFCEAMIAHHFRYFYDYYYFFKRLQRFVDHLPFFIQETTEFTAPISVTDSPLNHSAPSTQQQGSGTDYVRKGITIKYGSFSYGTPSWDHFIEHYEIKSPDIIDRISLQTCSQYSSFAACEMYCQEFSIAKVTDRFDGTPEFLLRTFRTMMAMRDRLNGFTENEFEVDFVSLEKMIDELKFKYQEYFYMSTMPNDVEFHEKGNDFSELVGFNPFVMAENCTLDLSFKYTMLMPMNFLLFIGYLWTLVL